MDGVFSASTVPTTRFGAPLTDVRSAARVLRARAARCDVALQDTSVRDLAAAVIGADAWCLVLQTSSLEHPGRFGNSATRVLARVLLRAAGRPVEAGFDGDAPGGGNDMLIAAAGHIAWVRDVLGDGAVTDVVSRAASDLSAAGPGSPLTTYADLLVVAAELE